MAAFLSPEVDDPDRQHRQTTKSLVRSEASTAVLWVLGVGQKKERPLELSRRERENRLGIDLAPHRQGWKRHKAICDMGSAVIQWDGDRCRTIHNQESLTKLELKKRDYPDVE